MLRPIALHSRSSLLMKVSAAGALDECWKDAVDGSRMGDFTYIRGVQRVECTY